MVKRFLPLVVAALIMGGCSFKSSNIEFGEPISVYMGEKAYAKAYFEGVRDDRVDTKTIGVIRDGNELSAVATSQNIPSWVGSALQKEMRAAGFTFVSKPENADFIYSFAITKLNVDYTKSDLTGKNMRLTMDINAKARRGAVTVTKNYKYDEQKWVKPIFDSEGIKKELEPFMRESVAATVRGLVELSKSR